MARLDWKGSQVLKTIREAQREGLEETGKAIIKEARNRVRVDSGKLRDSIKIQGIEESKTGMVMAVGSDDDDVQYAAINELGGITRNYEAQPFMRPAMDIEGPKLKDRIKKKFEKK
jgi:HK97 gp10 family phage protein